MNKFRKLKQSIDMFIGTLITVALLLGVVVAMTAHVYKAAKEDGFEGLASTGLHQAFTRFVEGTKEEE